MEPTVAVQLRSLFRRTPVVDMTTLERTAPSRSRRSLYRDLAALGSLTSYSHVGRYYTLRDGPAFDADGLWQYQGIGFSRHGTLKATTQHLVEAAHDGRTQRELQLRLQVRVHNVLLELVEQRRVSRQAVEGLYVYLDADTAHASAQLARRRERGAQILAAPPLSTAVVIEIFLDVIHAAHIETDCAAVAARLNARGVRVSVEQVEEVIDRHGLEKKTAGLHSPRLRR